MQTKNTTARDIIRGWAADAAMGGDYKEMAADYADAIRERAMALQDNVDLGATYDESTMEAMAEVRDHMPCGYDCPRTFWEWYNDTL